MLGGAPGGAPGGDMMGGLASMAMSFVYPSLKQLFEASTRRITATLAFREGNKEYTIEVVEWFAVPQLGTLPNSDDSTDPSSSSSSSSSGSTTPRIQTPITPMPGHT
jgi:hypothetical protein